MAFSYEISYPLKIIGLLNTFSTGINSSIKLEHIFGNFSFILLFIAVVFYWFDFSDTKPASKKLKSFCMIGANLSLTCLLALRWWESGHFPLSNLYESLIGLSWSFTSVHLFVTGSTGLASPGFFYLLEKKIPGGGLLLGSTPMDNINDKIGAITAPTALLTSVFATFFLPSEMLRATTLIPALKSNWLTMHVTVMVISYAFLLVGSLLSMAFCVYTFYLHFFNVVPSQNFNHKGSGYVSTTTPILTGTTNTSIKGLTTSGFHSGHALTDAVFHPQPMGDSKGIISGFTLKKHGQTGNPQGTFSVNTTSLSDTAPSDVKNNLDSQEKDRLDICIWLNTMSYRILGLGFPLLTIGILSGAVWANEAWGSYWSWDPKETWALITWLVFAIYFHSRYNRSSDISIIPASIASIGFFVIWICYLGVNLLQSGLHSYGWFGLIVSVTIF